MPNMPGGNPLKTIIWDVDDVLNDMMRTWLERAWLPTHPGCSLIYEQIKENPPHRLLGATLLEYFTSLDEFRLSQAAKDMTPVPETLEWFKIHGAHFRHMVLTAAPIPATPFSSAWVMRHFGRWIRSFHVVPSVRDPYGTRDIPQYDRSKMDFLRWLAKGDIFIDDNPENVEGARAIGLHGILIPRPWNGSLMTMPEALDTLTALKPKGEHL